MGTDAISLSTSFVLLFDVNEDTQIGIFVLMEVSP